MPSLVHTEHNLLLSSSLPELIGAGEPAQWFRTLTMLSEDQDLMPSTPMTARGCL